MVSAPAPQLTENDIFDIVHAQIAAAIGEHGEWSLTRRADSDTDSLFHGVVAHSVTTHVVEALRSARENLSRLDVTDDVAERPGEHVAESAIPAQAPVPVPETEPAAFGWQPAPITVWTDLKKPVTGQLAQIHQDLHQLVA
jgi:hypothetical protein